MLVFLARMYSLRAVFSHLSRLMDTAPPFLRGHRRHAKRFIRFETIDNTFLLSFLKTPSIGPDPEIESATSRSVNWNALPPELTQPRVFYFVCLWSVYGPFLSFHAADRCFVQDGRRMLLSLLLPRCTAGTQDQAEGAGEYSGIR